MTINIEGIILGISAFLCIGMFHPIVIKAEYYLGTRSWWLFLLAGIAGIVGSLLTENTYISAFLGIFAFSSLWGILELFQQKQRVKKGWFPMNPKRKKEYED